MLVDKNNQKCVLYKEKKYYFLCYNNNKRHSKKLKKRKRERETEREREEKNDKFKLFNLFPFRNQPFFPSLNHPSIIVFPLVSHPRGKSSKFA